ncbi:diacetylchitobiose ABC transporter ATP-binding protein MsiK [soil metagenome]
MATVTFSQATRLYPGATDPAVDRLDLQIEDGEFVVLVGPSGCGKSTSLRMVAGLEDATAGQIFIDHKDITGEPPKARDIAMVFQNYALYPHMTVAENMGYALKIARVPKAERIRRVGEAARMLDLEPYLNRKPKALSGGQRQRVAMGRAIVREPAVFLMDEPLSNLDAKLRVQTRAQIAALQRRLGTTTIYVTHDQTEALTMGDRIAVMKDGVLQQFDTPRVMYDRPASAFVASFIGSPQMNILAGDIVEGRVTVASHDVPVSRDLIHAAMAEGTSRIQVGLRPEDLRVDSCGDLVVEVTVVEELGADAYVYGRLGGFGPEGSDLVVRVDGRTPPAKGEILRVTVDPQRVHAFSAVTDLRL